MALAAQFSRARITPRRIHTDAKVTLEKVGDAFSITRIELETTADIPDVDNATFQKYALDAKQNCPVGVFGDQGQSRRVRGILNEGYAHLPVVDGLPRI